MKGREAYLETHVMSADPMELVCLLYQHATNAVGDARRHLAAGDVAARGRAISKAVSILGELTGSLNREAGGTISTNLERLYSYMTARLTEANLKKQDGPLAEVEALLHTVGQAWEETRARQSAEPKHPAELPAPAWHGSNLGPALHGWSA